MAKLPNVDRIAHEIYEAAARSRGGRGHRMFLGMSQIGDSCSRKLWYRFRGFTPVPLEGRAVLIFELGDRIEDVVVSRLEKAGYPVTDTQRLFTAHGGLLRGRWDGCIHGVTLRPHVLEIKSANARKFKLFKTQGVRKTYPVYYAQAQSYMGYSHLDRALVVVYCKDTSEVYTERIHFNREEFRALERKAFEIITAENPPDRAFESEDTMECRYCDFRFHCRHPEEAIQMDAKCGTCWYFGFVYLKHWCAHPDHPYGLHRLDGCPDWSFISEKDMPHAPLIRKPKVPLETLREQYEEQCRAAA